MQYDVDKLVMMAEDTVTHKKYVLDNCLIMAKYFLRQNNVELATELLQRGSEHDNSKFDPEEFRRMAQILNSTACFTDSKTQLSDTERKAIEYHWSHNRHHPEYFKSYNDMTEVDIIEMVCDWYARSLQYNTDFIAFVTDRQKNRFHFSEALFEKILGYCHLIQDLHKEVE